MTSSTPAAPWQLETIGGPSLLRPQEFNSSNVLTGIAGNTSNTSAMNRSNVHTAVKQRDPRAEQEQLLFEQRLLSEQGVAIRKINQHGKASLRHVRCLTSPDEVEALMHSSRSVMSGTSARGSFLNKPCLVWGKRKDTLIPLDKFTQVRKGKFTLRTKKSLAPSSCVLSLVSDDLCLDMEAPTRMDRDKFARAFSRFLTVPLVEGDASLPEDLSSQHSRTSDLAAARGTPPLPAKKLVRNISDQASASQLSSTQHYSSNPASSSQVSSSTHTGGVAVSSLPQQQVDDASDVSSLTGHGYDQELVEELHHALEGLRQELDESRAEAARAVKVAEQAIQSAEKSNSQEWQNTVTHKAAEAAALAHQRLSEALVKQREAEDQLASEKRAAIFWRKQAEVAEEEAGVLQTRAAAAEVQRAAVQQQLETERRMLEDQVASLRARYAMLEGRQRQSLEQALERTRSLEVELSSARKETAVQQQTREDVENAATISPTASTRKKRANFLRKKGSLSPTPPTRSAPLSPAGASSSVSSLRAQFEGSAAASPSSPSSAAASTDALLHLHAESKQLRQQFEMLRRSTADQLQDLPVSARMWGEQVSVAMQSARSEIQRLQTSLASESATRRKLLQEVQDLRGTVRVYCRPRPPRETSGPVLLKVPSQDTIMINTDQYAVKSKGSTSFEFDCIFGQSTSQVDVYTEVEDICLGALDGYRICTLAHGAFGSGKTYTLLGKVQLGENGQVSIQDHGVHLRCCERLFSIAKHRSDRYKDSFTINIVQVYDDRLSDLLVGTTLGESRGQVVYASEKKTRRRNENKQAEDDAMRLEIRSDTHGDTVVQGSISILVNSVDEIVQLWEQGLALRRARVAELPDVLSMEDYEAKSHVIATLTVTSTNIATGVCSQGRIQFADLAAADLASRSSSRPPSSPSRSFRDSASSAVSYQNRSLDTLNEVVAARCDFHRSVPYRNSTLTHLLRDSLESDTKVILLACISSDAKDVEGTAETLRFAARMRKLNIGKATKHVVTP